MKSLTFLINTILSLLILSLEVKAGQIFVPENCLQMKIVPCLLKANSHVSIKNKKEDFEYKLTNSTILRWNKFGALINLEVMQGEAYIKTNEAIGPLTLNGIEVKSNEVFISRVGNELKILDMKTFFLTQYQLPQIGKGQLIMIQSDFLSKIDLVNFISKYFKAKSQLVVYLKAIEKSWKKEFIIQNENQTKVLRRSIASIEEDERQKALKKQNQIKELKKVRETFFNRTFYR